MKTKTRARRKTPTRGLLVKTRTDDHANYRNQTSVPGLFAWACKLFLARFTTADLAILSRNRTAGPVALGWMSPPAQEELFNLFSTRTQNGQGWWLSAALRDEITRIVGGVDVLLTPRVAFLIACAIDAALDTSNLPPEKRDLLTETGLVRPPPFYFEGATNLPPSVGHMSAHETCRRWFRNLWLLPRLKRFDAFGKPPTVVPVELNPTSRKRLAQAAKQGEFRLSLVCWRRHQQADLVMHETSPGCFAVNQVHPAARKGLMGEVLSEILKTKGNLALWPELMLTLDELAELKAILRERGPRYPTLLVVGLTHQTSPAGAFLNEAVVLDSEGTEVMRHEKMEPFTFRQGGQDLIEDILPRQSESYHFLDTPVGRLVVNICKDIRSDLPMLLNRLLDVTLLVAPTYSKRLDFAADEARVLGQRQHAITAAVNPLRHGAEPEVLRDAALLYAPIAAGKFREGLMTSQEELDTRGQVVVISYRLGFESGRAACVTGPTITDVP